VVVDSLAQVAPLAGHVSRAHVACSPEPTLHPYLRLVLD